MGLRRAAVVIGCALAGAVMVAPVAGAHRPLRRPVSCAARGPLVSTVTRGAAGRLFTVSSGQVAEYASEVVQTLYGCAPGARRARALRRLTDGRDDGAVTRIVTTALGSGYALVVGDSFNEQQSKYTGYSPSTLDAAVYRLSNGRRNASAVLFHSDNGGTPVTVSTALIGRSGVAAWLQQPSSGPLSVVLLSTAGIRTLDPGPADPGSLSLTGTRLSWTDGGVARSAALG